MKNKRIVWFGFENELESLGFKVYNKDNMNLDEIIEFDPHFIVEREYNDGKSIYSEEIEYLKTKITNLKTVVWLIDTHVSFARHIEYIKHFDFVFMAISKYTDRFKEQFPHKKIYWLPLCFPKLEVHKQVLDKKYPISFVGRWGKYFEKRNEMLNIAATKYGDKFYGETNYDTPYETLNQSYITLNHSIGEDLNYRVFEGIAMGCQVVTNSVPDLFKIAHLQNIVHVYDNFDEMTNHIDRLLDTDNGITSPRFLYDFIQNHKLRSRINQMFLMIRKNYQFQY